MDGGKLCLELPHTLATETCEFILDKTQGVDLLVDKNGHRENLIQMAKGLGHKEICTLFECFVKKYR